VFAGSSRHTSRSASNLLSSGLTRNGYADGLPQSASKTGYSAVRHTSSSVVGGQSPMSVMSNTRKSSAGGLHTPRSALRTNKQQMPKSEPRSTSLHAPRLSSSALTKTGTTSKNGLSLSVREPTSSLPNSPHSSDPDSLDEQPGNYVSCCYSVISDDFCSYSSFTALI